MSGTSSPDSAADPAQLVKRRRTSGVFNTCAESLSVQEEQTKQLQNLIKTSHTFVKLGIKLDRDPSLEINDVAWQT